MAMFELPPDDEQSRQFSEFVARQVRRVQESNLRALEEQCEIMLKMGFATDELVIVHRQNADLSVKTEILPRQE